MQQRYVVLNCNNTTSTQTTLNSTQLNSNQIKHGHYNHSSDVSEPLRFSVLGQKAQQTVRRAQAFQPGAPKGHRDRGGAAHHQGHLDQRDGLW